MGRLFDLQHPLPLIIAAVVAVLFIALLLILLVRLFKRKSDRRGAAQDDRVAQEREWQFAAAAEQLSYLKDPSEVAKEISLLLREFLSMNVLAVYAGRHRDERILNVLAEGESPDRKVSQSLQSLPASFPALMSEVPPASTDQSAISSWGGLPGSPELSGDRSYQTSELARKAAGRLSGRPRMAGLRFCPGTAHSSGWGS
jgi:hypothetical protein